MTLSEANIVAHSPGPWSADDTMCVIADANDETVLSLDYSFPMKEADARLIAAAPDLLEACKALLALESSRAALKFLDRGIGMATRHKAWIDARAAIAKAEWRK